MNPLQVASLTTSLAPVAIRSLGKLADAFSLGTSSSTENSTHRVDSTEAKSDSLVSQSSAFSRLYKKLEDKLQSLLGQIPELASSKNSFNVSVESNGKLSLTSADNNVDVESLERWLNNDRQLTDLAAKTHDAKQKWSWQTGLAQTTSEDSLSIRIQTED